MLIMLWSKTPKTNNINPKYYHDLAICFNITFDNGIFIINMYLGPRLLILFKLY